MDELKNSRQSDWCSIEGYEEYFEDLADVHIKNEVFLVEGCTWT